MPPFTSRLVQSRARRARLFIGTATLAIALGSTAARAECVAGQGDTVLCSGVTESYVSTTPRATVTVAAGASVNQPVAGSYAIRYDQPGTLIVNGSVLAAEGAAVDLEGAGRYTMRIGRAGTISGARGIVAEANDGSRIDVFNDGILEGTGGDAIAGGLNQVRLTNGSTGIVRGAVSGESLFITNRGTIAHAGTVVAGDYVDLDNAGLIDATGDGPAITANSLDLVNRAGGIVRATGGVAIRVDGTEGNSTSIDNAGRIIGSVVLTGMQDDVFEQRLGGTVTGNVDLGAGDDAFWQEQGAAGLVRTVSGTLEGGEGTDTYGIRMTQSGSVSFGSQPTGFERYAVDLCGCDLDVTIAAAEINGGLDVSGSGTVTNLANVNYSGSAPALTLQSDDDLPGLTFVNRGTITANGEDAGTLIDNDRSYFTQFVNEGTINLTGDYGYGIHSTSFGSFTDPLLPYGFVNRGTITGSGENGITAVVTGPALNTGTISATGSGGVGLSAEYGFGTFVNDSTGRITGETAVFLGYGADITNRGVIESANGVAIETYTSNFGDRSTIINEGTIRGGGGVAIHGGGSSVPGIALANKGTIVGDVTLEGATSDVVWLQQGGSIAGNVGLGDGDDTLIVDIGRVNQAGTVDTSGLVSGTVDSGGGNDTLWLRSDATRTMNVLQGAASGFEAGTVYEAAGAGTSLTLQGPVGPNGETKAYHGLLRVAGDGRVVIDTPIDNDGQATQSIRVEESSTADMFGDGGQGLDLVIASSINGGTTGVHVDATHARRVELLAQKGGIGFTGGVGLKTGMGTEVLLSNGTGIRKSGEANAGILLQTDRSNVVNRTLLREDDKTDPTAWNVSTGVEMSGGTFTNDRGTDGVGRIVVQGTGIRMFGGLVTNSGEITSNYGNAIETGGYDATRIVNNAAGIIQGHRQGNVVGTAGAAIVSTGYGSDVVENAGAITGDVLLGAGDDAYIAIGNGSLTGNLDLGTGNDTVLTRDGAGLNVTGTVTGGSGIDAHGRSFTASGTFDLGANVLPADFELHGVEAKGAATQVTITSATTQTTGVRAFGDGTVINNADFTIANNHDGIYSAFEAVPLSPGAASLNLVNNGTIISAVDGIRSFGGLASFTNTKAITAHQYGVYVDNDDWDSGSFTFRNSGSIASANEAAVRIYSSSVDEAGLSIDSGNTGTISQTGAWSAGVSIENEYGLLKFANSGTIDSTGRGGIGARFESGGVIAATNSGTIQANGQGGAGMVLLTSAGANAADCPDVPVPVLVASLTNTGTIRANGGAYAPDGSTGLYLSAGVLAGMSEDYSIVRVTNAADGLIEATGPGSSAVMAVATDDDGYGSTDVNAALRVFELQNAGTIRGGADTVIAPDISAYLDQVDFDGLGDTDTPRTLAGGIQTIDTTDRIVNLVTGRIIGNVDLGAGDDIFENLGTLQGDLRLGAGDDTFVYAASSTFTGTAYGGAGNDALIVDASGNGSVNFDQFREFETLRQRGTGSVAIRGTADIQTLVLAGSNITIAADTRFDTQGQTALGGTDGAEKVTVAGTLGGSIDLGGGNDAVSLRQGGVVEGDILLGAGDDRLTIATLTGVTGIRSGGTGTDTLEFDTAGTYQSPVTFNGQGFDSFERLNVAGGVLSLTGDVSYETVSVTGGRLIGQAGTTITSANTIIVSHGATFGSAGTVNANIDVRGTLSPGASPGTMIVNGNVSFATGSNLLLEVAPTGSDLLRISGALNIAQGATMDITGMLTATPGGALDLVVAEGGINGGFTTINKSDTIFGFVATRGNKIQLVGEFQNSGSYGTNAQASIAYSNAVLGGGQMVQAYTNALPLLVNTAGVSNAAAFERLTPEPYGTAVQASIDKGLAVTDAVRNLRHSAPSGVGAYGFIQGLAQWSNLNGSTATGASRSSSNGQGVLGGVGYSLAEGTRAGVFVGTSTLDQKLDKLDASTKVEGMVIGAFADAAVGDFGLHALLAYDLSRATTRRTLPSATVVTAKYDLGGFVADISADYAVTLGNARIAPRVGLTYVAGHRDGLSENSVPFALDVAGSSSNALFGDAALGVSFDLAGVTPYVEAGLRQRLTGGEGLVSARYAAVPTIGPVTVQGATRDATTARLSAGVGATVAKNVRLSVGYTGEFGDSARHNISGGLSIAF